MRTVRVPDGFDPFGTVEVVIDSEHHEHDITVQFYKRNVRDYYDLEGESVTLVGEISADKPQLLQRGKLFGWSQARIKIHVEVPNAARLCL